MIVYKVNSFDSLVELLNNNPTNRFFKEALNGG